jgi:hypothetical protein
VDPVNKAYSLTLEEVGLLWATTSPGIPKFHYESLYASFYSGTLGKVVP